MFLVYLVIGALQMFFDDDDDDDDVCSAILAFWRAVRPSVRLTNAWIVTKRKKLLPKFLYHIDRCIFATRRIVDDWGMSPTTWNVAPGRPTPIKNSDFQSTLAVRPSERSSIITNRKFTTGFPMSLRKTAYCPWAAQRRLKNATYSFSVQKWTSFEERLLQESSFI